MFGLTGDALVLGFNNVFGHELAVGYSAISAYPFCCFHFITFSSSAAKRFGSDPLWPHYGRVPERSLRPVPIQPENIPG